MAVMMMSRKVGKERELALRTEFPSTAKDLDLSTTRDWNSTQETLEASDDKRWRATNPLNKLRRVSRAN